MKYEVSYKEAKQWKAVAQFINFDMACEFANQFANAICITSLETGEVLWSND